MGVVWGFEAPLCGAGQPRYTALLGGGRFMGIVLYGLGGGARWRLEDRQDALVASGEEETVEIAQRAVEAAARKNRLPPGRPALVGRPMTSTERNKRHITRLLACEAQLKEETRLLVELHRDMTAAGQQGWAGRVAEILRISALLAVAEDARRNAGLFASLDPGLRSSDDRSKREDQILTLADRVSVLAANADDVSAGYQQFEGVLNAFQRVGFYPDKTLVSAVARGYFLAS